jgi:hypothetical protein
MVNQEKPTLEKNLNVKPEKEVVVAAKKKIKKKKEKMVTVQFKSWETKGDTVTFSYSDDEKPTKFYTFVDGAVYTVPLKIAEHINSCGYPVSEYRTDEKGKPIETQERFVKRFAFIRTSLTDD